LDYLSVIRSSHSRVIGAIGLFSSNHFDGSVEASMTAAFVFGPAGAIIGLIAGAVFGKTGKAGVAPVEPPSRT
jgi:hypothetical protein